MHKAIMRECYITCVCETWELHQVNTVNNSYIFFLFVRLRWVIFQSSLVKSIIDELPFASADSSLDSWPFQLPSVFSFADVSPPVALIYLLLNGLMSSQGLRLTLPLINLTFSLKWLSFHSLQRRHYLKTQRALSIWPDKSFSQVPQIPVLGTCILFNLAKCRT